MTAQKKAYALAVVDIDLRDRLKHEIQSPVATAFGAREATIFSKHDSPRSGWRHTTDNNYAFRFKFWPFISCSLQIAPKKFQEFFDLAGSSLFRWKRQQSRFSADLK
jgi:hypothetical protein